jgi:hypothetical protein
MMPPFFRNSFFRGFLSSFFPETQGLRFFEKIAVLSDIGGFLIPCESDVFSMLAESGKQECNFAEEGIVY